MSNLRAPQDRDGAFSRLLRDASLGNAHAIGDVLGRYWVYLTKIANDELDSELRAKVGASDLVQQTFMEATQAIRGFRGSSEEEVRAWLRGILRHNILDSRRRYCESDKRAVAREHPNGWENVGFALAGNERPPGDEAIRQERIQQLNAALQRLSTRQQEVIRLRQHENLSFGEIGRRLDCTEEAARKQWVRSLEELGNYLRGEDGDSAI